MNTFHFWLWFFICVGAIVLEIAIVQSLVSCWFAVGAIFGLIAYWMGFDFTIQIIIFFIISVAALLIIRPLATRSMRGNVVHTNADRMISTRTRLLKAIKEGKVGELKANGLIWNAATVDGDEIDEGDLVEIVALEGSKVLVKKV